MRMNDFAVLNYAFTGAANAADITGGRATPVFASKVPQLRGATLTGGVEARLRDEDLVLRRAGAAVALKIQAIDCAQGASSRWARACRRDPHPHRAHPGQPDRRAAPVLLRQPAVPRARGPVPGLGVHQPDDRPPSRFCVQVTPRTNLANDVSATFVARDSAQLAVPVPQADCDAATPVTARHCGGVAV